MWVLIFAAMLLFGAAGMIYLISRFRKFTALKKLSGGKGWRSWLCAAIPLFLLLIVVSLWLGWINTVVCTLHLAGIWALCDLASLAVRRLRGRPQPKRYYAGGAALLITVVYLTIGWVLAHHVWQTGYTIETEKKIGSLRVIQFADAHVGATFHGEEFLAYVEEMQAQKPDLVVITGDFVDDDTSREDMLAACEALGHFEATYGVYYVYGNHDKGYFDNSRRGYSGADLAAELEKNGVTVLEDEAVLIDNCFYIIGRRDRSEALYGSSRADMEALVSGLDKDKFLLVLDHQPADYEAQEAAGVDLVLSGHTHGGQLLPLQFLMGMNDQVYGLEKRGNTGFIVTSGISDWVLQFKTGCKSEYVVIDLQGG